MFDPFDEMDKLQPSLVKGFAPAIDVYETKKEVVVETSLAGVDPSEVEVAITNDILTIRGAAKPSARLFIHAD